MRPSAGEKWFGILNYALLSFAAALALYPFLYVAAASISSSDAVVTGKVLLLPKELTFASYGKVMGQQGIWIAYANTVFYTVFGTLVNLVFTILGAYPLSKKRLAGASLISFFVALTMFINMSGTAGMIPFYLNLRDLGLLDKRFTILFAFAVFTFYVFLMRTFFQGIPDELEESAKVDGANDWQILTRIYLPLSLPALASIGLFCAVNRWNGYFWTMVILRDESKIPLQVLLRKLIVESKLSDDMMSAADISQGFSQETIIYATIIVSIVPILLVYPFIQKYFVKGMMLGAVKE
ncbi:Lactose transport system permease protein LacG [Paenibacillus konkukensis]|uniref:Lactose transport system permease protein LacG n=1 Tax=Paenibacillus konkukensis TaxID=2020716 RepID=A0ABY4RJD5_9BACL|nr:carbohydrate ABC transporter permease [Paenibacillus konkukensis]UQZ82322.1 Lactose transport system permease protein LacG [Paenibacillus konkukensis]